MDPLTGWLFHGQMTQKLNCLTTIMFKKIGSDKERLSHLRIRSLLTNKVEAALCAGLASVHLSQETSATLMVQCTRMTLMIFLLRIFIHQL